MTSGSSFRQRRISSRLWRSEAEASAAAGDISIVVTVTKADGTEVCSDTVTLSVLRGDIDGDADHNGVVVDTVDDAAEHSLPGVIALANVDDDDGNKVRDGFDADAATINDGASDADGDDMARLVLRRTLLPAGWTARLILEDPTNVATDIGADEVLRIFSDKAPGAAIILGPGMPTTFTLPADAAHDIDVAALAVGDLELWVEGLEFAGEVQLRFEMDSGGWQSWSDLVQLKVAPLILLHHLLPAQTSFVSERTGEIDSETYCQTAFPGATPLSVTDTRILPPLNGGWDPWAQDEFQFAYQDAPYKNMYVVLDSMRDRGLRHFPPESNTATPPGLLGPDFGHIQLVPVVENQGNNFDAFGNLEVSPPCTVLV